MYSGGAYISYEELFDRRSAWSDVFDLLAPLNLLHTTLYVARLNILLRHSLQKSDPLEIRTAQGLLLANLIDDEAFARLQVRFGAVAPEDRPLFHPMQMLNLLRSCILHCNGAINPSESTKERFRLGRACLHLNDLLVTAEEQVAIQTGDDDSRRSSLMLQILPLYEAMNPPDVGHSLRRSHVTFDILLKENEVRARIARHKGFDFTREFKEACGIDLTKWLDLLFACNAYYLGNSLADLVERAELSIIGEATFIQGTGVSVDDWTLFLKTVAVDLPTLATELSVDRKLDPRYDFLPFRSRPLFQTSPKHFCCVDPLLVTEKLYTGVHWLIHDAKHGDDRKVLFGAWGELSQAYVSYLLRGLEKDGTRYYPFPEWTNGDESFDGVLTQNTWICVMEFKGGFLTQRAKYSGHLQDFEDDVNLKIVPGCYQLASKLGDLYGDPKRRKTLKTLEVAGFKKAIPVLIVQDHFLRGPFVNWYLNRKFQEMLPQHLEPLSIEVLPLTVIGIEDLETMVESSEAGDFDFAYSLLYRAFRDPDMLSELHNFMFSVRGYGKRGSQRFDQLKEDVHKRMFTHIFPGHSPEERG